MVWGAANWRDYESQKDSFLLLCKFDVSTQNLTYLLFNITPTFICGIIPENIPLRVQISFNIIHFSILNIEYIKNLLEETQFLYTTRSDEDPRIVEFDCESSRERANL